jgi:methylglyoxal synthase
MSNTRKKRIAIVANNKIELVHWAYSRKNLLVPHQLIAAGITGERLQGTLNVPVKILPAGYPGEEHQLSDMIDRNELDMIIFLDNPLDQENEALQQLLQKAIGAEIIVAGNEQTADMLLSSLRREQEKCNELNDHSQYSNVTYIRKRGIYAF